MAGTEGGHHGFLPTRDVRKPAHRNHTGVTVYVNIVASGLLTGLVYGLAALGLSVIFGVVRVVNFAHGEMMVLGMYGAVVLATVVGIDPLLATPLVAGLLFVVGYGLQRGLVNAF